jgi:hypothetical protein
MDSPDAIAVDLRGNVMTCQNTGAKGAHKIGHVADFDAIGEIHRMQSDGHRLGKGGFFKG